ncbi:MULTISPECIES: DUF3068 domain-containing protein [unclassified Streptomyces]|uniref:DUF3068 domain-containing protein n=1 Tax=unclassified Streptomyces TaxID=2593676 RepID=UPI001BE7C8B9|nr:MULTISPECIES: DUF3068 domain-containing protein [unclassified Streptomyces]MBT2402302.1 DUF3068 domain-containing protein [Streptomyces sp. ISL-21]MBT2606752.1 DUF3068 domain-containing protein [Streptomyces sp. ISL-87]
MRRTASLVLLAVAVFLGALAPLLRWYAYPRLAKIPPSQYQEMVLEAKDATLLDYTAGMQPKQVDKVTIVQTLKGNVEASKEIEASAGKDVVVWDTLTHIIGPDGKTVSQIPERYIFDAHTQDPVHATGEMVDGDPVKREGIEFKWPFFTEPRDYLYFDAQTRTSSPIHYVGPRTFKGMDVYYFEQTVPWTKVSLPKKMPIEGIDPATFEQTTGTSLWYSVKAMFWVDPVTGAPVNAEQDIQQEMRGGIAAGAPDGKLTVFAGHVTMRADYGKYTLDLVRSNRMKVLALHTYAPIGLAAGGLGLFGLALWLEARGRRGDGEGGAPLSA